MFSLSARTEGFCFAVSAFFSAAYLSSKAVERQQRIETSGRFQISSPRFTDFRSFCAVSGFFQNGGPVNDRSLRFHEALNFGLKILGLGNISLKEKQYEVLKLLVVEKKDVLAVLPTGYGKSLIYQLLPPVLDFMNHEGRSISSAKNSSVLVISPLNTLIRDQIVKMREGGLNVCVLKRDRVTGDDDRDDVALNVPVEMLLNTTYDLIFAHPEVVVDSKKVAKLLRTPDFKRKIQAIVVFEAHLVIDWYAFIIIF